MTSHTIGARLAACRREHRMSQRELAEAAGVSVDTIGKLEQGQRHSARLDTLVHLATALGVPVSDLLGVPRGLPGSKAGEFTDLRAAIYDRDPATAEPPTLDNLRADLRALAELYFAGRFSALARQLPGRLLDARAATRAAGAGQQRPAHHVLAEALHLAAKLAAHVGYEDLAHVALLQSVDAARAADDDVLHAEQQATIAWVYSRQGLWSQAERLATATAQEIAPVLSRATPEHISVWGGLCHFATIALARQGRIPEAHEQLGLVQAAGAAIGDRPRAHPTSQWFGATFAAHSAVATAVAADELRDALTLAERVDHPEVLEPSTRARFMLNMAYAQTMSWRSQEAVDTLRRVDELTPELLERNGLARMTIEELLPRRRKQRLPGLKPLADRLDIAA